MATAEAILTSREEQGFWGHPKGLFYLAFTEAWERFSYYGMTTLLALYMVNQLLLPGHVENIAGFAGFRSVLESVTGPQSSQALASRIFGLYSGFVYFTPLLGGLIADRWTGQRTAVVIGALLMTAGHITMAFEQSFLVALLLLVAGSGFLKGNISAQVGLLYPRHDETRRARGFAIFSNGINFGSVFGPLLCGFLAQVYGWHYGFGVAGVFMLAGLATYLYGYRHLPARVAKDTSTTASKLTKRDWYVTLALGGVIAMTVFQSTIYLEIYNVFPIWIQKYVSLQMGSFHVPIPWFSSIDPLASILATPLLFSLWSWQASHRGGEPGDLTKIGIGALLLAVSNLILALSIFSSGSAQIPVIWPLLYCLVTGVGFFYYWPTLLSLVSRLAPPSVNATMMGVVFISLFVSSNLVGWIGSMYEKMTPLEFWSMHSGIAAVGGILALLSRRWFIRILE